MVEGKWEVNPRLICQEEGMPQEARLGSELGSDCHYTGVLRNARIGV